MDRRHFITSLIGGLAAVAIAGRSDEAQAMPSITPAAAPDVSAASEAVATEHDLDIAKLENAQYAYDRFGRPIYRRRRVYRPVVRRRVYRPVVRRRVVRRRVYRPVVRRRVIRRRYYY